MNRKLYSGLGLLLLLAAFLTFALLNNLIFSGVKLDLTEHQLFTLSAGSKEIVHGIDEPINLYFFFSDKASQDLTALRAYAQRVQELLEQYQSVADGKIHLSIIDPEPFSDREDEAATLGLQAVPVSAGNDLYFGLAGTNALDNHEVIPFFQPDKEEFLEYEVSKLIQSLSKPDRPRVGLMSSLKMTGDIDMQTFQQTPGWVIADQLGQQFEVVPIEQTATEIPKDVDVLVIVHPKAWSPETRLAVDQFAMGGGRILAFVDPVAEVDRGDSRNPMMPAPGGQGSDMAQLLASWGVALREGKIVGDSEIALQVNGGQGGRPVRHFAILGFGPQNLSRADVVTSSLESVNASSVGILDPLPGATTTLVPLIQSSEYAMPLDAMQLQFMGDPEELQRGFRPTGERFTIAARISGEAKSAFPVDAEGGAGGDSRIKRTDHLNVIVVADTDMLTDRMWVQVRSFFGQQVASPWANNGDFVVNSVDNLLGSAALISVRSRGRFTRPFDVVQSLRREAEASYLESANDLQAQLAETERKLSDLQQERKEKNVLSLSPEQEAAVEQFQEQKVRIRKQLRDVRHQLDKDIESLGSILKFFNTFFLPLLLTLALLMLNYVRMRRGD